MRNRELVHGLFYGFLSVLLIGGGIFYDAGLLLGNISDVTKTSVLEVGSEDPKIMREGPEGIDRGQMVEHLEETPDTTPLLKFSLPEGDYFKAITDDGLLSELAGEFVDCEYGMVGPVVDSQEKRPHYYCLSEDGESFVEPVVAVGPGGKFAQLVSVLEISEDKCEAGDSSCGGADTYGLSSESCSRDTFWCQTGDVNWRYCSSKPICPEKLVAPIKFKADFQAIEGDEDIIEVGRSKEFVKYFKVKNQGNDDVYSPAYGISENQFACSFYQGERIVETLEVPAGETEEFYIKCIFDVLQEDEDVVLRVNLVSETIGEIGLIKQDILLKTPVEFSLLEPFNLKIKGHGNDFTNGDEITFSANFPVEGTFVEGPGIVEIQVAKNALFNEVLWTFEEEVELVRNRQLFNFAYQVGQFALEDGVYTYRIRLKKDGEESDWAISPEKFKVKNRGAEYCEIKTDVPCFSADGSYVCSEADSDFSCPVSMSLCHPQDDFCLLVGESGKATESWCINGVKVDNGDGSISCETGVVVTEEVGAEYKAEILEEVDFYKWLLEQYGAEFDGARKMREVLENMNFLAYFYGKQHEDIRARAVAALEDHRVVVQEMWEEFRVEEREDLIEMLEEYLREILVEFKLILAGNEGDRGFGAEELLIDEYEKLLLGDLQAEGVLRMFDIYSQLAILLEDYGLGTRTFRVKDFVELELLNHRYFVGKPAQQVRLMLDSRVQRLGERLEFIEEELRVPVYLKVLSNFSQELEKSESDLDKIEGLVMRVGVIRNLYTNSALKNGDQSRLREFNEKVLIEEACKNNYEAVISLMDRLIAGLAESEVDSDDVRAFKRELNEVCK